MRPKVEFGDGVWIGDERQSQAGIHYLHDVRVAHLISEIAENAENCAASHQRGERVEQRDNVGVTVDVLVETIVRRVHDDVAEADGQREEALGDGVIPNLDWI